LDNDAYLQGFLSHLRHERRLSGHTASNYAHDVDTLFHLAGATPLGELDVHHARRFVAVLHGRGLQGRSLARALSAWRTFFRYLARDHRFRSNPFEGIRAPKAPKTLPKVLSPDEAARLVALPGEEELTIRDRAMLELFYSSGLRLSEVAGLTIERIDWPNAEVRVWGKGAKERIVPVGAQAMTALAQWRVHRESLVKPGVSAVFLTREGTPLSPRAIQSRLRDWAIRQGLPRHVHPHMLRHSFASHVLQSSGDLRAVQEMLGHASISTTQVYTHLDFQYLAKAYDAAHPRAKKKKK
jgi:integrase/recombinase XerC